MAHWYLPPLFFLYNVDKEWSVHTHPQDVTPNVSSNRVATTESSKCNTIPLVRVGPAFQHKSWAKEEGVWTLHSCQHCQKKQAANIIEPISLQKDRLLLENNWNNSKEMAEQQVLTKWCLFWGSGSKHANKTKQNSYSEKHRNQTSGQNIHRYKMWRCCKELVGVKPYHVAWNFFNLHPFIS